MLHLGADWRVFEGANVTLGWWRRWLGRICGVWGGVEAIPGGFMGYMGVSAGYMRGCRAIGRYGDCLRRCRGFDWGATGLLEVERLVGVVNGVVGGYVKRWVNGSWTNIERLEHWKGRCSGRFCVLRVDSGVWKGCFSGLGVQLGMRLGVHGKTKCVV